MEQQLQTMWEGAEKSLIEAYDTGVENGRVGYVPIRFAQDLADALNRSQALLRVARCSQTEMNSIDDQSTEALNAYFKFKQEC